MDYFILAERIKRFPGPGGNTLYDDWWPIGAKRLNASESPMTAAYHFATREEAQNYINSEKPEGRKWEIFFVENDDYANF